MKQFVDRTRRHFLARALTGIGAAGASNISAPKQSISQNLATDFSSSNVLANNSTHVRSLSERFSEVMNIRDFGARCDGINDDTPALLACLSQAELRAGAVIYMPPGTVNVATCTPATLRIPTKTTLRGAGMSRTTIMWDDSNESNNLFCGPAQGRGVDIALEDFTVVGSWEKNGSAAGHTPQGFPIFIQNVDGLTIRRLSSKFSRIMGIRAGQCTNVSVESCRVEHSGWDGINVEASSFVAVRNNDIQWCGDDAIAIHSATTDESGVRRDILVIGNRIFNAPGIKILAARQAVISNNQLDFVSTHGIGIETLPAGNSEGQTSTSSVVINGNVITNLVDRTYVDGFNFGVVGIAISDTAARAGFTHAIPGSNDSQTGQMIEPYAFVLSNSASSDVPVGESRGILISANIIERTMPPCDGSVKHFARFSDYKIGRLFTKQGWWDGPLPTPGLQGMGISISDGVIRDVSIHDNIFRGIKGGLYHGNTVRSDSISFKNNQIIDFSVAGVWLNGLNVRLIIEGNIFDGDPYVRFPKRTANASWPPIYSVSATTCAIASITPGLAPIGILVSSGAGIQVTSNRFRNVWCVSNTDTNSPETGNTFNLNIAECWPTHLGYSPDNRGIAVVSHEGGCHVCTIDSHLGDGASFDTGGSLILQAVAMPTLKTQWVPGRFVMNSQPRIINGKILLGWLRLTLGSDNVAGTDWALAFATTS